MSSDDCANCALLSNITCDRDLIHLTSLLGRNCLIDERNFLTHLLYLGI